MRSESGPVHVSAALSELIQRRGFAQAGGQAELQTAWNEIAGTQTAKQTRVTGISRGAMQIEVSGSALLSELAAFRRASLLKGLNESFPELKIKDLKFRLNSGIRK